MTYTIHYKIQYKRSETNSTTTIAILEKGYGGSTVNLSPELPTLQIIKNGNVDNIYEPTVGFGAILNVSTTPLTLLNIFSADSTKFIVKCYNSTGTTSGLFFQGYINAQGGYQEDYSSNLPMPITINVNDGMALLDTIYYKQNNGTFYTGTVTIGTVINNILAKISGLTFSQIYMSNDITVNGYDHNLFLNIKVNQDNYVDESGVAMTCREVLNSIIGGLPLSMHFLADSVYIFDPYNLKDTTKGYKYTFPNFTETTQSLGGVIDFSGVTISYYETGQGLDMVAQVDEVDLKFSPYNIGSISYDFNANASGTSFIGQDAGTWYLNNTVTFSGWTQSGSGHFIGVEETLTTDRTYGLWLTNTSDVMTYTIPFSNINPDSNVSMRITFNGYAQTKVNSANIFSSAAATPTYQYQLPVSIKVGNLYWNSTTWTATPTTVLMIFRQEGVTNTQFAADNKASSVQNIWITSTFIAGALAIPITSITGGTITFSIKDYWTSGNISIKTGCYVNFLGVLLKDFKIDFVTSNYTVIDNSGVMKRANLSTNLINKNNVTTIETKNGCAQYGIAKGGYYSPSNNQLSLYGLYRDFVVKMSEDFLLQSFISQYKIPRVKLSVNLNVKNYGLALNMKLISDNKYLSGKYFYIVNSTYTDDQENMEIEMIEIANSRESL
jgi:hypothetical protein